MYIKYIIQRKRKRGIPNQKIEKKNEEYRESESQNP